MIKVITSKEFEKNTALYLMQAETTPIYIERKDQPSLVLLSAVAFELLTKGRIARKVEDLDSHTLGAIERSSVSDGWLRSDTCIPDWEP